MRILLFGPTGQVGWELQRALAPLGELLCFGRNSVDLASSASIASAIARHEPDILVNAAAYTQVDRAESDSATAARINADAVSEMAEAMAARGGWFVHYSTDYVFDGGKAEPYKEGDPTAPLNVYGTTKRAGEAAIERSGGRHLVFRTSWIHSARGHNFVRTVLRLARERENLRIVGDQSGSPTSAELVADVTALALKRVLDETTEGQQGGERLSGLYHLTAAGETTWHGLACRVIARAEQAGAKPMCPVAEVKAIGTAEHPTPARRPVSSRLDTAKLREAFGVALPDWRHHVDRTVAELLER